MNIQLYLFLSEGEKLICKSGGTGPDFLYREKGEYMRRIGVDSAIGGVRCIVSRMPVVSGGVSLGPMG